MTVPPASTPTDPAAAPTLKDVQGLLDEAMRKMFGGEGAGGAKVGGGSGSGVEGKLQLLKLMSESIQTLQQILELMGQTSGKPDAAASGSPSGSPVPSAPSSLGNQVGEAVGDKMTEAFAGDPFAGALGDMLSKVLGEKLTLALANHKSPAIENQFAQSLQALVEEQRGTRKNMAALLEDTSEKLDTLLKRPTGSDLAQTARQLGEILGEASNRVQVLTSGNLVQRLNEAIAKALDAVQKQQHP